MARHAQTSGTHAAPEVFKVLFDGWALAREPASPAALHLLALFDALPEPVEAVLALPGPSPHRLPARVEILRQDAPPGPRARLAWEQRGLARAVSASGARLLHLVESHPPLTSPVPVVLSPADSPFPARPQGLSERLRAALAVGAAGSVSALLWPADLPPPGGWPRVVLLPPILPAAFLQSAHPNPALPPGYVLYHGPADELSLRRLLAGWSWAGPAVGETFPLVLAGLSLAERHSGEMLARQASLEATVRLVDALTPAEWGGLYEGASVVVNLGPLLAWGSPLLAAMARARPLVAEESEATGQRVGAAAYLVPPGDGRALGAAITTLVVENELAEGLGQAAAARAAEWGSAQFGERLMGAWREGI